MKYNVLGVLLIVLMLSLSANAQRGNKPKSGTITGVIQRTESDGNGLWSVWIKVHGTTYELTVANVSVIGGKKSDLKKGISIRVTYRNLALSEQDYFYSGEARTIAILKPPGKKTAVGIQKPEIEKSEWQVVTNKLTFWQNSIE